MSTSLQDNDEEDIFNESCVELNNSVDRKRVLDNDNYNFNNKRIKIKSSDDAVDKDEESIEINKLVPYNKLLEKTINNINFTLSGNKDIKGRLIIGKIILENFKSYLGKKVLGNFDSNFTSVIGNNGSGKSNIIDGFLFAFDYSPKKIRMKKYCELIHNSNRGNPDFARVSIYFQRILKNEIGTNQILHEFDVTRYVYRNNRTKYELCGKTCTRDDIKCYLREQGLGLDHDRFLILQGEIENISLLKPKAEKEDEDGMLEFLDDIIGTSIYKNSINEINSAIVSLQRELEFKKAKSKDAERYKMVLSENIENMIKSIRIKNAIVDQEYKICCVEEKYLKNILNILKNNLEEDIRRQETILDEEKKVEEEINIFEVNREEMIKELNIARNKLREIERNIAMLHEIDVKNTMKINEINKEIILREQKNNTFVIELEKLDKEPVELMKKLNDTKEQYNRKEIVLEILFQEKNLAENEFLLKRKDFEVELDEKEERLQDEKSELKKLSDYRDRLIISMEQLMSEKKLAEENIDNIKKEMNHKEEIHMQNLSSFNELNEKIGEINISINKYLTMSEEYNNKILSLEKEIEGYQFKLSELKDKYEIMTEEGFVSSNKIHNFLLNLNCNGFRGRLGDLASIDKKYDIALSTLGGRALNNYVVNTVDDAQYLISKLREKKIGKASFMTISQINKNDNMNIKRNYPCGALRAFDLLYIPEDDIKKCFYHVFQESLTVEIIDDIEPLKNALKGNFQRIVTLDGAIAEGSGKISGGGKPFQGAIGIKTYISNMASEEQRKECKEDIKNYEEKIKRLQNEIKKLYDENIILKDKIKLKNVCIQEYDMKMTSLQSSIKSYSKLREILEEKLENSIKKLNNIKIDENAIEIYEEKIKEHTIVIDEQKKDVDDAQKEYDNINDKIIKLRSDIMTSIENKYDSTLSEIKCLEKSIDNLSKLIGISQKKHKKSVEEMNQNEKKLKNLIDTLTYLNISKEENESKRKEWEDEVMILNQRIQNLQISSLNNEYYNELIRKRIGIKEHLRLINIKIENIKKKVFEKEVRYEKLKSFIDNAKYNFFVKINMLPKDIRKFSKDECYFNERVYKAEMEFIEFLRKGNIPEENIENVGFCSVKVKDFNEIEDIGSDELEQMKLHFQNLKHIEKVPIKCEDIFEFIECLNNLEKRLKIYTLYSNTYDNLKKKCCELTFKRLQEFNKGFDIISKSIKQVYQQITFGGDAEMEPCDKFDPYNYGILYTVRPPGKSWKKMTNLSGGEKTLASLAFVFGLHVFNPTPLYIMDEIDAALDFRNVGIIAEYINERTKDAQFIVISLRQEMYEKSSKVLGIWKLYDTTSCFIQDVAAVQRCLDNYTSFDEMDSLPDLVNSYKNLKNLVLSKK
uniref:Structural maintenance of chromosomes protein n=1 Tax=Parastrongyloides trichosuri TaxID=131310 RepID=A0A0N4ZLJ8_PARTI